MFDLARIGENLPVSGVIDKLPEMGPLVVEAPPGTGKTTLVPPAVANKVGKTVVTAPRRVAVRAAAARLQQLSGNPSLVGYSIRGEHTPGTLVEFVTPGVLLNRLLKDPDLTGVNAVIIDEVHERQLDTDLVLAMCMEVAMLRDDLYLAAMSATLDARKFADHMGAQILSTQAETHPLEIRYAPHPERIQGTREFYRHVAGLAKGTDRTLVFVPGAREVDMVAEMTGGARLHGRLSSAEQDEALGGSDQVVVATSVAESSITVPGVRRVVDAGLARTPKRDARGMSGLVTVSEARTSADQRAGRAARLGPGTVIRAFSEAEYAKFQPDITPEILTADLTSAALSMAVWGSPDLPLIDAPPEQSLIDASRTLESLNALENGEVTAFGRELSRLPVDPRLGAALLTFGSQAASIVAKLSQDDPKRLARLVPDKGPCSPGEVIAAAFPQWIAKKVGEGEYLLASGTRAKSTLNTEWIAAAEVQRTRNGAVIREAEPIAFPEERVEERTEAKLEGGKVRGRKVTSVGAIELTSTPVKLSPAEAAEALTDVDFNSFPLTEEEQRLKNRLDFLHAAIGSPDVAQGDYSVEVERVAGGASISDCDMRAAMLRQLPWDVVARLDELAPERIGPGKVDYSTGKPVVRVKLQGLFGQAAAAEVAGVKVVYHLLSPAGRELAVTDDLASFWDGPYQQVRKEMRGRYPKHPWPEDPWTAEPTLRTGR